MLKKGMVVEIVSLAPSEYTKRRDYDLHSLTGAHGILTCHEKKVTEEEKAYSKVSIRFEPGAVPGRSRVFAVFDILAKVRMSFRMDEDTFLNELRKEHTIEVVETGPDGKSAWAGWVAEGILQPHEVRWVLCKHPSTQKANKVRWLGVILSIEDSPKQCIPLTFQEGKDRLHEEEQNFRMCEVLKRLPRTGVNRSRMRLVASQADDNDEKEKSAEFYDTLTGDI
jgi:hypothetical protein